jgi:hypothetical protein
MFPGLCESVREWSTFPNELPLWELDSRWTLEFKQNRKLKVKNRLDFCACRRHATYCWKALNEGYKFFLDLTSIRGLHTKLFASKVAGVSILGISGLPLGSFGTKWHLGVNPWPSTKYTIKGKVLASPESGLWWVFVNLCLLVVHPCTKSASILH